MGAHDRAGLGVSIEAAEEKPAGPQQSNQSEQKNVLKRAGKCIRFSLNEVRELPGRELEEQKVTTKGKATMAGEARSCRK